MAGQTQAQTQAQNITLSYETRSRGRFTKTVAITKCGEIIDPYDVTVELRVWRKQEKDGVIEVCGQKISVYAENWDSNKHLRRYVTIPANIVKAVIKITHNDAELVDGEGGVEERVVQRTEETERYRFICDVKQWLYRNGDTAIVLKEEKLGCKKEILTKPLVHINAVFTDYGKGSYVAVKGDTYQFRQIIKKHGFRWDGLSRVWQRTGMTDEEVKKLAEELREAGADVELEIHDHRKHKK